MRFIRTALTFVLFAACSHAPRATSVSPTSAADELLAADRAFSVASARTDLVSGLSAMFASDVQMPLPTGTFAEGIDKVREALRANPDNLTSRIEWTPVRAGVSADGRHGFTIGYMTLRKADSSRVAQKYLAYWVKGAEGWRVAAYKRARRPDGEISLATLAPAIPARFVPASNDASLLARNAESLKAAEKAFSDEAQIIGLGPAFAKHGSDDAMNMGSSSSFTVGAANIAKEVGGGSPDGTSALSWGADRVLVASSGDLGVSLGTIRRNGDTSGRTIAFFTIWRRATPDAPWRYIAE